MKNLDDLFQDTLGDIYNSEQQILKALPVMQQNAQSVRLKEAFGQHLRQTEQHVSRLEQVSQSLGVTLTGKACYGTMGIIQEAQENQQKFSDSVVGDASLIADAQKVEHYEISNYGTLISWMQEMEVDDDLIDLMETTLQEEEETDDLLASIADDEANPKAFDAWKEARTNKASLI